MSFFKKRVTQAGKTYFYKDGKAVKEEDVDSLPALIKSMEPGTTIELEIPAPVVVAPESSDTPSTEHVSIISGEPATRRRWLNNIEYWVTEEEHKQYTLGKLAQVVREKSTPKTVDENDN